MSNANVAFQRSKTYRLLSYCFFYPDEEFGGFLRSGEFVNEIKEAIERYPLKTEIEASLKDLKEAETFDVDKMADEHIRFLTLKSGCPPYENEYYRSRLSVYTTEEMADIAGFYKAFGMNFTNERPDHIAAELEFMHLVTLKEAEAASKGEGNNVEICISVERKFLQDHLGRWVDAFSDALKSEGSLFYSSISQFLRCWINAECRYLDVSPQKVTNFKFEDSEDDAEDQICMGAKVHS
ncbi:MAG: TorD/DmsD family molecular chaperone [Nitrospirota bacterium]